MTALKIANAPCSWGVLEEFEDSKRALGYKRVLDEMAEAGYAGTELGDWGFLPTDSTGLEKELTARNLAMLAAFVPVDLVDAASHKPGAEKAVQTARLISSVGEAPCIVLSDENAKDPVRTKNAGRIQPEHEMTDRQWQTFIEGVEYVAREVLDRTGVKTVFHHHCAGRVETPQEIERFLRSTNPATVGLCLDTGHYAFGGGDAADAFNKHMDRIWHVHFKDVSPEKKQLARKEGWSYHQSVENGVFCELGEGEIDFPKIIQLLNGAGYKGWIVVEQDVLPGMGSPKESAVRSRRYLQSLGV